MMEQDLIRDINSKEKKFSEEAIEQYIEGCSEVALALHSITENIRESGKKPVILIPSRGAVPIFLNARESLKRLDNDHFLVDPRRVGYYPRKIFEFLSQNRIDIDKNGESIDKNPQTAEADIILYPFTADVSTEQQEVEWLARKLRESCTRAFYDVVFKTGQYKEDLSWYYFLMSKLQKDPNEAQGLNPESIIEELRSYNSAENSQIVLIDTVVSGRASEDIVSGFASIGHKVVPILAVDSRSGGHFQPAKKAAIERAMSWEYLRGQSPFIEFPLITEDKGAALLGVSAVNFSNFNEPGFFRQIDPRFRSDFLPQSCVWMLPPTSERALYSQTFNSFMDLCIKKNNGEPLGDLVEFQHQLKPLISSHGEMGEKSVKQIVHFENGISAKETASHIISITLPQKVAKDWVREFAVSLFKNST